ncbi:hypothetical protein VTG60DRAFT_4422 [Thermothelomyces hinnuleus]
MTWDETSWSNSTLPDNSTLPPPNSTIWTIPPNPGRSLQPDIIACAVVTFIIASIFVALRFYTRGWLNNVLGASDWCILPALLCAAGVTASSLEQVVHGVGKHAWEVDIYALPKFERASWYGILFYNLSLTLSRISIILLYNRIFTYTWIKRAIRVVLILVTAIGIWLVVSVCTACVPLKAFWDWSLFYKQPVFCQPPNLWWANAGLHIASDLVVMALPMPVLSSLNLPRRQKYAIIGVFALGFFVCIISIVRLVTLIGITRSRSLDAMYTGTNLIYWSTVEVNASISCACIMTLKPLIQRVFPRLLSPSKSVRELPTLQWITPINHDDDNNDYDDRRREGMQRIHDDNDCRHSNSAPASPLTRRESHTSAYTAQTRRGSVGVGLHHNNHHHEETLEKSRYYHNFTAAPKKESNGADYDLDRDLDLEAQRTCSNCSPVSSGWSASDDVPSMRGDESGSSGMGRRRRSSSSSSSSDVPPETGDRQTARGRAEKDGGRERGRARGAEGHNTPPLESELARYALRAPPRAHLRKPPPPPPPVSVRSEPSTMENPGYDPKSGSTTSGSGEGIRESWREVVELREGTARRFPLKTGGGMERSKEAGTGRDRAYEGPWATGLGVSIQLS